MGSICPTCEWRVRDWWNNVSRRVKYKAMSFGAKENGRLRKRGKKKRILTSQSFRFRLLDGWRIANGQK